MNKLAHALILFVFGITCLSLWGFLHLVPQALYGQHINLPGFTLLCLSMRPMFLILPVLAAVYCLWVLFRKKEKVPSWTGFFATTMSVLVLAGLQAMIAAYLPVVSGLIHLAKANG